MQTVAKPPENATEKSRKRGEQLRATIDAGLDALARAVDSVRASAEFKRYLDVQARFHRYSWHNTLLIASQRPDATRVAGYRTWQSLKRQVRKGERGIAIFAPCTYKREEENADTGETEERTGIYFRVVHVFDVSQTDGEPLPNVDVPDISAAADDLLGKLRRVAESRGIAVTFQPMGREGLYGVSKKGSVEISNEHATGQQAKTLAHELAHEAMHWEDRGPLTRSIAELEAESVAYVVCRHFGLDVEVRASRYIALWQGDSKALRESLQRISETAKAIIDDAENAAGKAVAA